MADSSRVPVVQAGSGDPSRGIQVQVGTTTSADPSRYIPVEIDTTNLDPSRFIRLQSGSGDPSRAVYYYSAGGGGTPEYSFYWTMASDTVDYSLSGLSVAYKGGATRTTVGGSNAVLFGGAGTGGTPTGFSLAEFNSSEGVGTVANPDIDLNEGTLEFDIYFDLDVTFTAGTSGAVSGTFTVDSGFSGSGAEGTFTASGGVITGVTLTNVGSGYKSNGATLPTITVTSGSIGNGTITTRFPDCSWFQIKNEDSNETQVNLVGRSAWQDATRNQGAIYGAGTGAALGTLNSGSVATNNAPARSTASLTTSTWHRVVYKWRRTASPYLSLNLNGGTPTTTTTPPGTDAVTFSNSGGNLLATYVRDWRNLVKVRFTTTGTLPTGLATGTDYWIVRQTATTATISSTSDGATIIPFTDAGSGTHTILPFYFSVGTQVLIGNDTSAGRRFAIRNVKIWKTWRDDVV